MKNSVFVKYYPQFLLLIVAFTFFTRMYRLHIPEEYMFDEVYHAVTAKLMVDGDMRAYEWHNPPPEPNTAVDWLHPPYAKLTQAASMAIFGKNSFGWRFSSVIFGCLVVLVTAKIAEALFKNKQLALLSAFLVSLDGLLFTMSRIAMNDVHVTFFILLSMWQYILYINSKHEEKKYILFSSIAAGLAIGTKWSGAFAIGFIGITETIYTLKTIFRSKTKLVSLFEKIFPKHFVKINIPFLLQQIALLFVTCILIPVILYLGSYSQMFLMGKDLNHLIEMHKNTWWYQTNLTATHPAQSKPIQWFLNTKPVWISVDYETKNMRADIYAIGNPALFWLGNLALFASVYTLILNKLKKKPNILSTLKKLLNRKIKLHETIQEHETAMLGLLLFAYAIVWMPWQLSPRIMFFYHYLPAVPLLTINLSYWLYKLWNTQRFRLLAFLAIALIFTCFVVLYPHMSFIKMPIEFKENVYFFFDFWKQT